MENEDLAPAEQFLDYLRRHDAVRGVLQDAVFEELVAEGAARGYQFSVDDLMHALQTQPKIAGKWSPPGN